MSFPTEFPQAAVGVVIDQVRTKTLNKPQLALAIYEIEGYVLYKVFGDVKRMIGALPKIDWEKVFNLLQDPRFLQYADALKDAAALYAGGLPAWRIGIKIAFKYGPAAVGFIREVLTVIVKV